MGGVWIYSGTTHSQLILSQIFRKTPTLTTKKIKKFALKMYQFDTKRVNVMENHHQRYSKADVLRRISSLEHVA